LGVSLTKIRSLGAEREGNDNEQDTKKSCNQQEIEDGVELYVLQPISLHKVMFAETEAKASNSTPHSTTTMVEKSMKHPSPSTHEGGPAQSQEDELCEILTPRAACYMLSKVAATKEQAMLDNTRRPRHVNRQENIETSNHKNHEEASNKDGLAELPTVAQSIHEAVSLVNKLWATPTDPEILANLIKVVHRIAELQEKQIYHATCAQKPPNEDPTLGGWEVDNIERYDKTLSTNDL
jgi:hypothetical protein